MVRMKALFFTLLLLPMLASASALSDFAATLQPGEYAEMPTNLTYDDLHMGNATIISWSDSMAYDSTQQIIQVACKRAGTYNFQQIQYDIQSNLWTVEDQSEGLLTSGHCYDGNAIYNGYHHVLSSYTSIVRYDDGASWQQLPYLPMSKVAAMSLTTTPQGLIAVSGGEHGAGIWNGVSWSNLPSPPNWWGSYHVFSEYNPVSDVTIMGGGNGGNRIVYKYDGSSLTQLTDAPVDLGASSSLVAANPAGSGYLVYSFSNNEWWDFDVANDAWSLVDPLQSPPTLSGTAGAIQVPIHDLGVLAILTIESTEPTFYVYKPVGGTTPEPTPDPTPDPTPEQCPEPVICPEPVVCPDPVDVNAVRDSALQEAINAIIGIQ